MTKKKTQEKSQPMKISQAARIAGVSKQTVEYYILVGLVSPKRNKMGKRIFDEDIVRRIRLVQQLNKSGYSLRSIRETYLKGK